MSAPLKIGNMADFFHDILPIVQQAKLAPDADLPFLTNLETQLIAKWHQPQQMAMNGQGQPPTTAPQGPPPGAPTGPPQLPPGIGGGGPGIGVGFSPSPQLGAPGHGGALTGPSMPASDELRRMLAHAGGPHH